jgi:hypothetical protein
MNDEPLRHFEEQVAIIVGPIVASMHRKRQMREEMVAHLWQVYQEEFTDFNDAQIAINVVAQRFGDTEKLRNQLQESIPWMEQMFVTFLGRKENQMSRAWIAWCAAVLLAFMFADPSFVVGVLVALCCVGLMRYCNRPGNSARLLRPMLGLFGLLFGPSLILPALAKYKMTAGFSTESGACLITGILILLAGVALLIQGLATLRVRPA